jgi:hypothetical protein
MPRITSQGQIEDQNAPPIIFPNAIGRPYLHFLVHRPVPKSAKNDFFLQTSVGHTQRPAVVGALPLVLSLIGAGETVNGGDRQI